MIVRPIKLEPRLMIRPVKLSLSLTVSCTFFCFLSLGGLATAPNAKNEKHVQLIVKLSDSLTGLTINLGSRLMRPIVNMTSI